MRKLYLYNLNIFTEKKIRPELVPILGKIQYKNFLPIIIGSYSLHSQVNAGDIDVDIRITSDYDADQMENEIKKILNNIKKSNNIYFIELKVQYKNGDKIKYNIDNIDDFNIIKDNYKDIEYIKIDLIIYLIDQFKELSVNYWFNPNNINIVNDILKSIEEERKEGNYFKIIKRYFSILKILGRREGGEFLTDYLNQYMGKEYKILSNLKAIKELINNYDDEKIREKIRDNLRKINIKPNISIIDDLINKIQNKVNEDGKKFIDKNETKIKNYI